MASLCRTKNLCLNLIIGYLLIVIPCSLLSSTFHKRILLFGFLSVSKNEERAQILIFTACSIFKNHSYFEKCGCPQAHHTAQPNLQIFAKTMSGFKSRFAPGEASRQRGYKIYSEIVRFSSDLVEISSDLVEISSELVEISSELISRILELMIISTSRKTSESKFRTTFPAIISTIRTFFLINNNCRLLCSFFASTHHGL